MENTKDGMNLFSQGDYVRLDSETDIHYDGVIRRVTGHFNKKKESTENYVYLVEFDDTTKKWVCEENLIPSPPSITKKTVFATDIITEPEQNELLKYTVLDNGIEKGYIENLLNLCESYNDYMNNSLKDVVTKILRKKLKYYKSTKKIVTTEEWSKIITNSLEDK